MKTEILKSLIEAYDLLEDAIDKEFEQFSDICNESFLVIPEERDYANWVKCLHPEHCCFGTSTTVCDYRECPLLRSNK